jgi:hypothetical protein
MLASIMDKFVEVEVVNSPLTGDLGRTKNGDLPLRVV